MSLQPQQYVTLGLAAIGFVIWLVRLEGRVNGQKDLFGVLKSELDAAKAKAEAEAKAHRDTSDALIRVEEAVKHLTRLFEQQFTAAQSRRSTRRTPE